MKTHIFKNILLTSLLTLLSLVSLAADLTPSNDECPLIRKQFAEFHVAYSLYKIDAKESSGQTWVSPQLKRLACIADIFLLYFLYGQTSQS